jgi:hypothetical protein
MQLIAWRTIGKNPCDDPPVTIIIASREKDTDVFPWRLPVERAVEMFGQDVVDEIRTLDDPAGPGPVPIYLEMKWEHATLKAPKSSGSHRSSGT